MQNLLHAQEFLKTVLPLCLVTNSEHGRHVSNYDHFLEQSVRGGVTMVQYRDKSTNLTEVRDKALHMQRVLKPLGVSFVLNDHVELAAEIDADGVHVGQTDMSILEARRILGPHKIIGLSIESLEELDMVNKLEGLYYVTASAVFPSKTKPDCKKIWGPEGLQDVLDRSNHPVTGIGGIIPSRIKKLKRVAGYAVVGWIHDNPDPELAARELRDAMRELE